MRNELTKIALELENKKHIKKVYIKYILSIKKV